MDQPATAGFFNYQGSNMESKREIPGITGGYAAVDTTENRPPRTFVYNEDGDHLFSLAGDQPAGIVNQVLGIYKRAFLMGEVSGERQMQAKFRALIGAAQAVDGE